MHVCHQQLKVISIDIITALKSNTFILKAANLHHQLNSFQALIKDILLCST